MSLFAGQETPCEIRHSVCPISCASVGVRIRWYLPVTARPGRPKNLGVGIDAKRVYLTAHGLGGPTNTSHVGR